MSSDSTRDPRGLRRRDEHGKAGAAGPRGGARPGGASRAAGRPGGAAWLAAGVPAWAWAAAALAAFALSLWQSGNPDLWAHLAYGRSILASGFPRLERWCLAGAGGRASLEEWLFQVGLYGVFRAGGHVAVALWRGAWSAAALAALVALLRASGAARRASLLLLPLVFATWRPRMDARPEQLSLFFTLLFAATLERHARENARRAAWLVPLQALWANVHLVGSFLGPALGVLYALPVGPRPPRAEAARPGAHPAAPRAGGAWLLVAGLAAATLVSPHPLESLRFVAGTLGRGMHADPLIRLMGELRPWQFPRDASEPYTWWLAACLAGALLGGLRVARFNPRVALLAAAGLAMGCAAIRLEALGALLSLPALALCLAGDGAGDGDPAPGKQQGARGVAGAALGALACTAGVLGLLLDARMPFGLEPRMRDFPVRAMQVADSLHLRGPVLNLPEHGGYVLWARGDSAPPLVDGRSLGNAAFHADLVSAVYGEGGLERLFARWNFEYAVLPAPRDPRDRLAADLAHRPGWALLFADDAGLLLARVAADSARLAPRAYRLLTPDYPELAAVAGRAQRDPALAAAFEAELERGASESPLGWWGAESYLADFRMGRGEFESALRVLDAAQAVDPSRTGLQLMRAQALLRLRRPEEARRALRAALSDPASAEPAAGMLKEMEARGR